LNVEFPDSDREMPSVDNRLKNFNVDEVAEAIFTMPIVVQENQVISNNIE
jgi:hypothetical protein